MNNSKESWEKPTLKKFNKTDLIQSNAGTPFTDEDPGTCYKSNAS